MMPFLAILRHDLGVLLGSWLVRLWVAAAALLTLLTAMTNWAQFPTAPLIASLFAAASSLCALASSFAASRVSAA